MSDFYVDLKGQTAGPFSIEEVRDLYASRVISDETLYARNGAVEWLPIATIFPLIAAAAATTSQPAPPAHPVAARSAAAATSVVYVRQEYPVSSATRGMYIVIGLLFGGIGLHSFYSGRPFQGLFQLLLGLTGIGLFCTIPWAILSIIFTDTDGEGRRFA